jgi:hypothetical protein
LALRANRNPAVAAKLQYRIPQEQWAELLELIGPKPTRRSDRELLAAIERYAGPLNLLPQAKKVQSLLEPVRDSELC